MASSTAAQRKGFKHSGGDLGNQQQETLGLSADSLAKKMSSSSTPASPQATFLKFFALVVLVLQNALLVLVMRYSQIHKDPNAPLYLASTAVFMGEVLKIVGSFFLLLNENSYNLMKTLSDVRIHVGVLTSPREFFNLSVPAFLYVLQNNLAYLATANLDPAPYQLLYQFKIFTTALLSILLLKKVLTGAHWRSLLVLFVGVVLVQFSTMDDSGSKKQADGQNPLLGLAAVLVAVTCSGLSGVWFEKILKSTPVSVWIRNIQLALISLFIATFSVYTKDYDQAVNNGFFSGYTPMVWLVIFLQGGGGLIVAVVVKYADNILKGFATSVATVFSTVASVLWFDFHVSAMFAVGAVLVLGSAYMYNLADMAPKPQPQAAPPQPAASAGNAEARNGEEVESLVEKGGVEMAKQ